MLRLFIICSLLTAVDHLVCLQRPFMYCTVRSTHCAACDQFLMHDCGAWSCECT